MDPPTPLGDKNVEESSSSTPEKPEEQEFVPPGDASDDASSEYAHEKAEGADDGNTSKVFNEKKGFFKFY